MKRKIISRIKASEQLSLSTRTIDRYIREGRIEAFKPYGSRRVLIYADSLAQENLQSPKPIFSNKF
jgi:excisionase family DNA binding protein